MVMRNMGWVVCGPTCLLYCELFLLSFPFTEARRSEKAESCRWKWNTCYAHESPSETPQLYFRFKPLGNKGFFEAPLNSSSSVFQTAVGGHFHGFLKRRDLVSQGIRIHSQLVTKSVSKRFPGIFKRFLVYFMVRLHHVES